MSDYGRFAFEPLLNLVNGRVGGMEVRRCQTRDRTELVAEHAVWGTRQLAEFDSGIAIASVLSGTDYDATVPLHVDVLADTVVHARRRLGQLHTVLRSRDSTRPTPPILLEINPALSAAPPHALAEGIRALRADGFGIGFDAVGRGVGIGTVAELAPDLVKIEASLVHQLPYSARARTIVKVIAEVCRAVGVRISAVGVSTPDELAALRDHGIAWAQGPLLAEPRRRPSTAGILLPIELMPQLRPAEPTERPVIRPSGAPGAGPRHPAEPDVPMVAELALAAVSLSEDANAEAVRTAFGDHPQVGCVLLLDAQRRPAGFLDRNRFMIAISGPFGRALYANRPARGLAEEPRTLPANTDARRALEFCLAGDRARSYDDVVLVDPRGVCVGVVRVTDLLQEVTGGGRTRGAGRPSAA